MNNPQIASAAALLGRVLLSAIFVQSGCSKLTGYAGAGAWSADGILRGKPGN